MYVCMSVCLYVFMRWLCKVRLLISQECAILILWNTCDQYNNWNNWTTTTAIIIEIKMIIIISEKATWKFRWSHSTILNDPMNCGVQCIYCMIGDYFDWVRWMCCYFTTIVYKQQQIGIMQIPFNMLTYVHTSIQIKALRLVCTVVFWLEMIVTMGKEIQ